MLNRYQTRSLTFLFTGNLESGSVVVNINTTEKQLVGTYKIQDKKYLFLSIDDIKFFTLNYYIIRTSDIEEGLTSIEETILKQSF